MPVLTATPEQVEQCVTGLKRTIDRQAVTIEGQARQLQDALCWAALWKRAAKLYRHMWLFYQDLWQNRAPHAADLHAKSVRQAAEIERLRGALAWYVGRPAESIMFDGGRRAAEALSQEPAND